MVGVGTPEDQLNTLEVAGGGGGRRIVDVRAHRAGLTHDLVDVAARRNQGIARRLGVRMRPARRVAVQCDELLVATALTPSTRKVSGAAVASAAPGAGTAAVIPVISATITWARILVFLSGALNHELPARRSDSGRMVMTRPGNQDGPESGWQTVPGAGTVAWTR